MKVTFPRLKLPIFWIGLALSTLLLTLLPVSLPGVAQSGLPQVDAPLTLVMGTEADYIPFEYRYPSEPAGEVVGFDIDLANQIANELGATLQIQEMPFDQLFPALQSGELDFAIAAITPTEDRQQFVDFSNPYFESRHALVSPRTRPVRTVTDLRGERVVVQQGSVQETEALRHLSTGLGLEIQLFALPTVNEMITAVREGNADVAITEELVAEAYLENNPTLVMDVLGEIDPTPVAIAFPKSSNYLESFNQVLADMEASGELQQLARQWFTVDP